MCFAIWTLLDANQLYHNALVSPPGARRSASIAVLRPIAAVSNALGLSSLVNWADTELGRNNSPGSVTGSGTLPPAPVIAVAAGPPNRTANGLTPHPHGPGHINLSLLGSRPPGLPPIPPPTPRHPVTVLDVGDSIGEDLGLGLGDAFSNDPYVHLLQKGQIDTGLVNLAYYNWPSALETYLRQYHPAAVVIMMGANDEEPIYTNGQLAQPGSKPWEAAYEQRAALMMAEGVAAKARVMWVGLPPLQEGSINSAFAEMVNSVDEGAAAKYPGVSFVPSWKLLSNSKGGFTQYLQVGGNLQQIRTPDGVHLAPAGYDLLANYLVKPMERAWGVNLHAH